MFIVFEKVTNKGGEALHTGKITLAIFVLSLKDIGIGQNLKEEINLGVMIEEKG